MARNVKLRVAHAPGMCSPPPRVIDPDMHHGTCVTHVPWCTPGSVTRGFPLKSVVGKTFPAFPALAQPANHVSSKRPMEVWFCHRIIDHWYANHCDEKPFNSTRHIDAYIIQWTWSLVLHVTSCRPFGARYYLKLELTIMIPRNKRHLKKHKNPVQENTLHDVFRKLSRPQYDNSL